MGRSRDVLLAPCTDTMTTKKEIIRDAFEQALVDGLKGAPLIDKDGEPVVEAGGVVRVAPEASFLSVVRAYLKDLVEPKPERPGVPVTGEAKGVLKDYLGKSGLPFGSRAQ